MPTPTIADAFVLAERAHRGQQDKAGNPYIDHPRAVAALLAHHGRDAVIAGLLHDAVEDSKGGLTFDDLRAAGYSELIVTAIESVTWSPADKEYEDLIGRAAAHPLGRHVKLADNTHNSWPGRVATLAAVNPKKAEEQAVKYAGARATLLAAGATLEPHHTMFSWGEDPLPCPVLSDKGQWCSKQIPDGWAVRDGHAGGHSWTSHAVSEVIRGGHFDATALLSGQPADGHTPADCPGPDGCGSWPYLDRDQRALVEARLAGGR